MTVSASDAGAAAARESAAAPEHGRTPVPAVDVVLPVHDEQEALDSAVRRLHAHLTQDLPYSFRITIADNASTDGTPAIADALTRELDHVVALHDDRKGRGRALKSAWSASDAQVVAYMDVDLSTDLAALPPLVAPLLSGHSDVAIGTRLGHGARVVRGAKRELVSRCYNLLVRGALAARFSDAQCGFKAVRADVARALLPYVDDTGWFFDTELLVLAERAGLRIHEVPVDWIDDPRSTVDIRATALADLRGVARLLRGFAAGTIGVQTIAEQLSRSHGDGPPRPVVPDATLLRQAVRFAAVGVVSTVIYLAAFVALRGPLDAQSANLIAMLGTAAANFAAHRRYTFGVRGAAGIIRHQFQGLVVFGVGLSITAAALLLLHRLHDADTVTEISVLVAANVAATFLRFALLRGWVFRYRRHGR